MKNIRTEIVATVMLSLLVCSISIAGESPSFSVMGSYSKTSLSLLVGESADQQQLKKLVYDLREARVRKNLKRMIPPTTPGGSLGDYAVMDIYIFTDPQWASTDRLKKFIRARMNNAADRRFLVEYAKQVAAYYSYSAMTKEEEGSIGVNEEFFKSVIYLKLF